MWKPVEGYVGLYEVSDDGQVKSLPRKRSAEERILVPHCSGKGYDAVALSKDGVVRTTYVHRLVASAFVPKPNGSDRLVVNHKDGNKRNNSANNLEWVTYSANNYHAYENGLKDKGERYYNAKLSAKQVSEIRQNGKYTTFEQIAEKYGVTKATIRDVLIGKTWRDSI